MTLTLTDLFAGAGGSSTGATQIPGVEVRFAANHWKLATEVHNANHPGADHLCADISQYDPRAVPRTDLLWASPECTNHSVAKGKSRRAIDGQPDLFGQTLPDAAAERSRATMWDVPRFAEAHQYRAVIVENVVDVVKWTPYRAWLMAMDSLGYNHTELSINSMHSQHAGLPAPQSRDRYYGVFWRKGDQAPDLEKIQRPPAWCPRCEQVIEARKSWKNGRTVGRYRAQYVFVCATPRCGTVVEPAYLPAAAAIDWTLPGKRIGDRAKPLAEKTRARIAAGIARYWRPFTLEAAGHTFERRPGVRTWPADHALTTLHTTASKALAVPVEGRDGKTASPVTGPLRTMTTRSETALALDPFIAELRGGGSVARSTRDPLATLTAGGTHHGLVTPYYGRSASAHSTDAARGTLTTHEKYGLVMRNNTARGDQGQMSTPVTEPMRTLTTAGHQSLITPSEIDAADALVDDCLFRMLEPGEAHAAMAFPDTYQWSGNRREQFRLSGNAVTPPAARDIVSTIAETLAA